jgi:hypothetical protein
MKYEDKSTSTKRKHKLTLGPNLSEGFCFIHGGGKVMMNKSYILH